MKIAGRTPGVNRGFVTFYRPGQEPFRLAIQALPYGFSEKLQEQVPDPEPPLEFAREKSGAVIRDEFNLAVQVQKKSDPKYVHAVNRARELRFILRVREGLRADTTVTFDTDADAKLGPVVQAERFENEFRNAGFSGEELLQIQSAILDLNRGGPQRVEEKMSGFLSATPSAPDGKSPNTPAAPSAT